jgi:hypothetical protein
VTPTTAGCGAVFDEESRFVDAVMRGEAALQRGDYLTQGKWASALNGSCIPDEKFADLYPQSRI